MALPVSYPLPDLPNLLLHGADGLQGSLGLGGPVTGRIARLVFPLRCRGVQLGQAGIEPRGQGLQFDQGGVSTGIEFVAGSCTVARCSGGNAGAKRPRWKSLIQRKTLLNS